VAPGSIHNELVLMRAFTERQQDGEVSVAVGGIDPLHHLLPLPTSPIAHDHHFLGVLVGLRHPVEIDGLGGTAALVGVATLKTLVLLNHSNHYSPRKYTCQGTIALVNAEIIGYLIDQGIW
jgi:hypothetical protein